VRLPEKGVEGNFTAEEVGRLLSTEDIFMHQEVRWVEIADGKIKAITPHAFRSLAGRYIQFLKMYPELRRIAAARMRVERPGHTLQATAVVHQLYLELVKIKAFRPASPGGEDENAAFLGLSAYLIKQLLIHHARPLSKRAEKVELPDLSGPSMPAEHSLVEIDKALNRLGAINPALRRVVELRVFEGLTREEIAREMGCGTATVARHWSFARNWLEEAFAGSPRL
jgi:RNA polymerase sigma factor (TIGR02999 family)